jgi:PAS domain S-box-containing protein
MTFGQRLRELRTARGMTQRELAQEARISFAYVSKLETGAMPPPRHRIIVALATAVRASDRETDELFGLARKIPHELLDRVDAQTIRMLRSLKDKQEAGKHRPKTLLRMAEPRVLAAHGTHSEEVNDKHQEMFQALVENSMDGIVILGAKLEVLYQNPAVERVLGYRPGELVGEGVFGMIHPEDMRKTAHRLSALAQIPGDSDRTQLRVRHKDGAWHAIDVCAYNLLHNPAINGIVIQYRDISDSSVDGGVWAEQTAALLTAKEYHLTESELRVLTLIVRGQTNSQIAEQLVISLSTVRFHVTNIIRKLGVSNRTEAAALAARRHLVS